MPDNQLNSNNNYFAILRTAWQQTKGKYIRGGTYLFFYTVDLAIILVEDCRLVDQKLRRLLIKYIAQYLCRCRPEAYNFCRFVD